MIVSSFMVDYVLLDFSFVGTSNFLKVITLSKQIITVSSCGRMIFNQKIIIYDAQRFIKTRQEHRQT